METSRGKSSVCLLVLQNQSDTHMSDILYRAPHHVSNIRDRTEHGVEVEHPTVTFQHSGAPPQRGNTLSERLNAESRNQWLGQRGAPDRRHCITGLHFAEGGGGEGGVRKVRTWRQSMNSLQKHAGRRTAGSACLSRCTSCVQWAYLHWSMLITWKRLQSSVQPITQQNTWRHLNSLFIQHVFCSRTSVCPVYAVSHRARRP
jgi:hypothetical protein